MTHKKSFPTVRQVIYLFLALVALRGAYYASSDGFNLERIKNFFPKEGYQLGKPTEDELKLLKEVCAQSFSYLGKGSQAYAFASSDGKYVLKLFKCYHLKPVPWAEELPLRGFLNDYRNEQLQRRYKKTQTTLESYKIAHNLVRDECGILYLQIVPSDDFHQMVSFTDKINRRFTIDLANYGFILQKKAELVYPTLERWIKENKIHEAKEFLHSLVNLIVSRSLKGVQDQDPDLHKNAGIIDTRAYCIDIGGFHLNDEAKQPHSYEYDLKKTTNNLQIWLKEKKPELAQYLDEEIKRVTTNQLARCQP
jgi:hypothetical protein